ncbi:magnesium-transporting ATPase (P-type) [Lewinella marina]|uniref:Uncharacterized protein n=1 Tax=Neolewinella marina TaxID=438751 RepID=A0A2G0CE19_9BACT|nr:hypothetical protein [Neolewinella marina]NJB87489.1 magnesium-transporting ATPase (P-type) [Neolewinella marina]PHK98205.1 hypothetical protein CGL56_10895 [Neolewinella marina]
MSSSHHSLLRSSLIGGALAAMIIFIGTYLLGTVTNYEAIENLQEVRPTLRFTASGMMTSTATILALMLTLLSFSQQSERKLKAYHYNRIGWIARFAAGIFIAALVLLMVLNVPISNAEETFAGFYNIIYYVLLSYTALMGGCMITIILLLYQAARDIILIAHPNRKVVGLYAEEDEDPDLPTKRERERLVIEEEDEASGGTK